MPFLLLVLNSKQTHLWRKLVWIGLSLLLWLPVEAIAENLRVLLVLSGNTALYQTFVKGFTQNLPSTTQVLVQEQAEAFVDNPQKFDLIVSVGLKAGQFVGLRTNTPLLAVMLPKASYEESLLKQRHSKEISAIYLDQPWDRQIALVQAVLPNINRVGVLYSAAARLDVAELGAVVARHKMVLYGQMLGTSDGMFSALDTLLDDSEALLAVPDSNIYSSNNIRNILLTTYRRGVPLIGLSQAYVNAGALCAVFSTPEQIAVQASAMTLVFAQTRKLPDAEYPSLFTIAVNQEVARTLSVPVLSPDTLRLQMDSVKRKAR